MVWVRKAGEREIMMLMRDLRGRCEAGMESQVRRPMRTALIGGLASLLVVGGGFGVVDEGWVLGGVVGVGGRFVIRAKKARSAFRGGQGRVPRRPMPRVGVVATMRVRGGRGGIDAGSVGGVMIVRGENGEICNVTDLGSGLCHISCGYISIGLRNSKLRPRSMGAKASETLPRLLIIRVNPLT